MKFINNVFAAEVELCPDGSPLDQSVGCIEAPAGIVDSYTSLSDLLIRGADFLLIFAGSIAVIVLILSATQYSLAMGDEVKIDKSKRNMKWAGIGLFISLSAYLIVEFVLKNIV